MRGIEITPAEGLHCGGEVRDRSSPETFGGVGASPSAWAIIPGKHEPDRNREQRHGHEDVVQHGHEHLVAARQVVDGDQIAGAFAEAGTPVLAGARTGPALAANSANIRTEVGDAR